jgi:hypothetical protein
MKVFGAEVKIIKEWGDKDIKKIISSLILVTFCICCCTPTDTEDIGWIPETPVNFEKINSEFDDYNSDYGPSVGGSLTLCFSSNRNSKGQHYDIIQKNILLAFDEKTEKITAYEDDYYDWISTTFLNYILPLINTNSNEFGPYTKLFNYDNYLFFYATDKLGNLDIFFVDSINNKDKNITEYYGPYNAAILNSEYDDAYPTFNNTYDEIYFSSNRDSTFDIYKINLSISSNIYDSLTNTSLSSSSIKADILSSNYDDKCPFIINKFLVFASNREGGFGGFDLWYSRFIDGEWSLPENFGENINSEYDEFRPIVETFHDFRNDFMVFSSNRPGGKGGFDLYYVGVKSNINE